jgi:hypothetical protein
MLRPEHPLAALKRVPVERQGPRRIAQRPQASRQIVHAGERLRMLQPEHSLAALKRVPVERQGPRRVAQRPQASRQIVHAGERLRMLQPEHPLAALKHPAVVVRLSNATRRNPWISSAIMSASTFFERVSREGDGAGVVAHAVRLALPIDPMLAADKSAPSPRATASSICSNACQSVLAVGSRLSRPVAAIPEKK